MSRSVFGWDLPPGCTQRHIDEAFGGDDPPCECCGHDPAECICQECPYCGECGNPACYNEGHESDDVRLRGKLEFTPEQEIGRAKLRIANLKAQIADEEMFIGEMEARKSAWEYAEKRNADKVDGYDRDDLGESPDF